MNKQLLPVSLIIPVFNAESWIDSCLENIFSEKYLPDEIIIVDDFSSDKTVGLIESSRHHNNIKLIKHTKNKYAAQARYTGLKAAKNDYIVFLYVDDRLSKNAIFTAYNDIIERDLSFSIFNLFEIDGKNEKRRRMSFDWEIISGSDALKKTIFGWSIHGWGLAKKSLWLEAYQSIISELPEAFDADEIIVRFFLRSCDRIGINGSEYIITLNPRSTTQIIGNHHVSGLKSRVFLFDFYLHHGLVSYGQYAALYFDYANYFLGISRYLKWANYSSEINFYYESFRPPVKIQGNLGRYIICEIKKNYLLVKIIINYLKSIV